MNQADESDSYKMAIFPQIRQGQTKQGKNKTVMPIPDYQTVMRPLLEVVQDGTPRTLSDVRDRVCDKFSLTDEERREMIASGKQTVIQNRVGWARTYMNKAGLLEIPDRGKVKITPRGIDALKNGPDRISVSWLKQFPEFQEFHNPRPEGDASGIEVHADVVREDVSTPDEQMEVVHKALMEELAEELLATIRQASPTFFERLVVDLMIAMGYGGSRKEAGQATKATNDDGIDGVIKEDRLGLDVIYLQAKRWTNTVHRPEIDKFIGSLTRQRAKKGVFITTSDFSVGARDCVNTLDIKVVLIDGRELARMMIDNNLGVTLKQVYEVKSIDSDYFVED
jgi:restriction system protein